MNGVSMSPHLKWGIGGVVVGLILLGFIPWWLAFALIVVAIAVPATAWLMLDESQRRRYRELRRRQRGPRARVHGPLDLRHAVVICARAPSRPVAIGSRLPGNDHSPTGNWS